MTRLREDIANAEAFAASLGAAFDGSVDTIYLGGGTPTTLAPEQLEAVFRAVHDQFDVLRDAEITVECAPGTLRPEILDALVRCGTNRVSLGTQSFVDEEIRSVGRLHTAEQTRVDIAHLREKGIDNINLDLIAGLPHQTAESWRRSLDELVCLQVWHASVYMLEIDDDSRLGSELIAGGERYHAHHVPDSDLTTDMYLEAVEFLERAGLKQYEISNFAREGRESGHNLKYWTRQPYFGFGLDAHSMLLANKPSEDCEALRFSTNDDLESYLANSDQGETVEVDHRRAWEETMFLGLRLNRGVDLCALSDQLDHFDSELKELKALGLIEQSGNRLRLTARGRLLSNEVFERFIEINELA